jgi:hypothetical protein
MIHPTKKENAENELQAQNGHESDEDMSGFSSNESEDEDSASKNLENNGKNNFSKISSKGLD